MLVLPISSSWILSRTAERVYLCCAISSLALSGTWIGTLLAQVLAGNLLLTSEISAFLHVIFLMETLGAAVLWVAMLYFWLGFDQSSWFRRALWLVVLMSVLPFFWALYYFLVYRVQLSEHHSRWARPS